MNDIRENLFFILPNAVAETSGTETTAAAASSAARAATMGSKASGLLRLAQLGLPVPPAFVLGTPICREYFARGGQLPDGTRVLMVVHPQELGERTLYTIDQWVMAGNATMIFVDPIAENQMGPRGGPPLGASKV